MKLNDNIFFEFHLFALLKRVNLKAGQFPTICFVLGLGLPSFHVSHPYTEIFPITRPCASVNIDMLRCPRVQILKIGFHVRLVKRV